MIEVVSVNDNPTAANNFLFDFEGNILRLNQGNIGFADVDNDNFNSLTIANINASTDAGADFDGLLIYDASTTPNGEAITVSKIEVNRELKDSAGNTIFTDENGTTQPFTQTVQREAVAT